MSDVKSYSAPGLVQSSLNPTQLFVTLADFDTLQKEVERLEQCRAEVQAICEDGKHWTKHTQLQMCRFLDGLRNKAVMAILNGEHLDCAIDAALKPAEQALQQHEVKGTS